MQATGISLDRTIDVPSVDIPSVTYPLRYSSRLVRTINYMRASPNPVYFHDGRDPDFYDTLKVAAEMAVATGEPITLPSAGEEHQVYVQKSPGARRLRDVDDLKDYFGVNDEELSGHTLTALRFHEADLRRPYNVGDKITVEVIITDITPYLGQIADPQFTRENWKDIIDKINKAVAKRQIPYARGQVVDKTDPTLGIWIAIRNTDIHSEPYALHAWLRKDLVIPQDPISGYCDVAVQRWCGWRHGGHERCLGVVAYWERSDAGSDCGFRPVIRGSLAARVEQR